MERNSTGETYIAQMREMRLYLQILGGFFKWTGSNSARVRNANPHWRMPIPVLRVSYGRYESPYPIDEIRDICLN